MAETFGLSCWPSTLALESKLSHNLESHPGLVPRLSHHRGKNSENQEQSQVYLNYAEVHPVFAGNCKYSKNRCALLCDTQ